MPPTTPQRRPAFLRKTDLRRSHLERARRAVWDITDETGRVESESELDRLLFDMPDRDASLQDSINMNMDALIDP